MRVFNRHVSMRGLTVFGLETLLVSGSVLVAARLHDSADNVAAIFWRVILVTVLCELCFYYNDLYDLNRVHSRAELLAQVLQAMGAAAIALAALSLLPSMRLGSGTFLTTLAVLVVAMPLWRLAFDGLTSDPHLGERLLIVGTGPVAMTVARHIRAQHDFGYRLVGFIAEPSGAVATDEMFPVLGTFSELPRIVAAYEIRRIVVGLSNRRGRLPIEELLEAKLSGVRVEDAATTYERMTGKILVDDLKPSWLIFSDGFRASTATRFTKRVVDLVGSAVGLVVCAPLMGLTALVVRIESPGAVLYRQERVGENGRPFTLYKFRSMRLDAEHGTPVWAQDHDPRITRVGRFIRMTRLDELPQLWNVFKGEMSFVGPRPERPFFVEQLAQAIPFYLSRHAVKPGVTGWAQVRYRYGASVEDSLEKLRYDLYYIKHLSIVFDLTILIDTVKVMVCRKGAQ
ncbi:MAG TPA: TIGR03013 family XrtA/PEP-CTERM system glycosyltransferase [Vicinamibacterales bacterium]|jgi:sugar transferase (PEP-CTERM system associated)